MKKFILSTLILIALGLLQPSAVYAETVCTQMYGEGVVCGASIPEVPHVPVKAAIGDFSLLGLSLSLGLISTTVFFINKRNKFSTKRFF